MLLPALLLAGGVTWGVQLYRASLTEQGTANVPPVRTWPRIMRLLAVADELRAAGMRVSSLVRDDVTNEMVGGEEHSLHKEARAIDGVCDPADRPAVLVLLAKLKAQGRITRWIEHNVGSGMHFHVELPE